MFDQIRTTHDELLATVAELEALVAETVPDRARLANVRWRLSRISGRRLKLMESVIYPHLLDRASVAEAGALRVLRTEGGVLRAVSAKHVGWWTIGQVMADWAGYRRASTEMTRDMRARVASEKAVIYPLVQRYASALPAHA